MSAHSDLNQLAHSRKSKRDRIAQVIMFLLGIATLSAFAQAVSTLGDLGPKAINIEGWRMLAFPAFAGLFFLLAWFPRRMPGLWELLLLNKIAVVLFLLRYVGAAAAAEGFPTKEVGITIWIDGVLVALTLTSYFLARGWRAWSRQ